MVRAIDSLDSVRDETRIQSYLCRIAERVCLDMMRSGARPMPTERVTPSEGPEALTIRKEEAELVRRTLMALSERQAQALWMRDAMGEGVPAVAATLGVTEGSARVMLTRARKQMREGWTKVAAMIPGLGIKLPAPLAKLIATTGVVPALLAPAAVIIAAVLVIPDFGTTQPTPSVADTTFSIPSAQPQGGSSPSPSLIPSPSGSAATSAATDTEATSTAVSRTATPATTRDGDGRVTTLSPQDVTINRNDPAEDDVTAGDEDVLGIGTSVDETLTSLGVQPPPEVDATTDVPSN